MFNFIFKLDSSKSPKSTQNIYLKGSSFKGILKLRQKLARFFKPAHAYRGQLETRRSKSDTPMNKARLHVRLYHAFSLDLLVQAFENALNTYACCKAVNAKTYGKIVMQDRAWEWLLRMYLSALFFPMCTNILLKKES